MRIAHIALWTDRPETLRDFYVACFGGRSGPKYTNPAKGFVSYFVRFDDGASLEICSRTDIRDRAARPHLGYCHIAFDCGSREAVDAVPQSCVPAVTALRANRA
ncbi:VOC family protein [Alistipes sp.]|uniref:VOC family protein n=1 Tax=Alistipes sp. TaxID=1872444 RepID=UPI003AF07171